MLASQSAQWNLSEQKNVLVTIVIDTFVQELKTYVQMRLSNRISINFSFILDFQGRLEDKLRASLDKLANGSKSLAQSIA